MKLQTARGVRDFGPQEQLLRQEILETLRKNFELYGFNPIETPIIERYETLTAKYGGGSEIVTETFKLTDQGSRPLGLRYEMTTSLCRFIGMNPQLNLPFKVYQTGPVFRDGPIKLGRYRQFWQCDIDIIGCKDMTAESELLRITLKIFESLGLKAFMKLNSRKILNGIIEYAGVPKQQADDVILTIDKLDKIGRVEVEAELKKKKLGADAIARIFEIMSIQGSNEDKLWQLSRELANNEGVEGLSEMRELLSSISGNEAVSFEPSLARGLSYYTGTVFEVYLKEGEIKSSLAGGGRYDRIIQQFLGSGREYPAVGISFGLDVIFDALQTQNTKKSVVRVFVIPIKNFQESQKITEQLRHEGIAADIDLVGRGISKNLSYANALGIPYVMITGPDELSQGKVKLKDMKSGEEKLTDIKNAIKLLK